MSYTLQLGRDRYFLIATLALGGLLALQQGASGSILSFAAGAAGLFAIHERLRRSFDPTAALITAILIFGGTSLFWSMTREPSARETASVRDCGGRACARRPRALAPARGGGRRCRRRGGATGRASVERRRSCRSRGPDVDDRDGRAVLVEPRLARAHAGRLSRAARASRLRASKSPRGDAGADHVSRDGVRHRASSIAGLHRTVWTRPDGRARRGGARAGFSGGTRPRAALACSGPDHHRRGGLELLADGAIHHWHAAERRAGELRRNGAAADGGAHALAVRVPVRVSRQRLVCVARGRAGRTLREPRIRAATFRG